MGRRSILTVCAIISGWCWGAAAAGAATVYPENGAVFVNNGDGFVQIDSGVEAEPGAQVLAKPGGNALISYDATCAIRVGPGEVKLVHSTSPCSRGASLKDSPVVDEDHQLSAAPLIAAGAVAATIAGVTSDHDGDSKPASP